MSTKPKPREPPGLWTEIDGERHRVVFIEYRDRHPFGVVTELHRDHTREPWFRPGRDKPGGTSAEHWDFEWCKRDGVCYYHNSGGGGDPLYVHVGRFVHPDPPPGLIWAADDVALYRWLRPPRHNECRRIRPAELLRMGYRRLQRPLILSGGNARGAPERSRDPFAVSEGSESGCYYCATCDDWLPRDSECEHYEWCDRCGCPATVDGHVREDGHDDGPTVHGDEEEDDDEA